MLAPLAALIGVSAIAYAGLHGFAWSDYEAEALRPVQALMHGDFTRFAALAPAYGGSLLLRAPFALLPSLWGGGPLAAYRALAAPCLLAAAALGIWLYARMRHAGAPPLARAAALALVVCNPLILPILEIGHPEEILCAVLCVAAVLLAGHDRPLPAGLALGVAIGCKYWPVIALGPVLLALPDRRWRCLLATGAGALALLVPVALAGSDFVSKSSAAASTSSAIFQPWQLFWFFGLHGRAVHAHRGSGYRVGPSWTSVVSHPLLIALALGAAALLWWRRRAEAQRRAAPGPCRTPGGATPRACISTSDALLLLTLSMLIRCLFDTFDNVCYSLPFLFALLAWECCANGSYALRRPPMLALCATALCWISFESMAFLSSANGEAAFFLAWTVPATIAIATRLYAPSLDLSRTLPARRLRRQSAPSTAS